MTSLFSEESQHEFTCPDEEYIRQKGDLLEAVRSLVGKETGETAQVERWNNTLRQRLAPFVRMTLSFSKSGVMHEACLLLFLHR